MVSFGCFNLLPPGRLPSVSDDSVRASNGGDRVIVSERSTLGYVTADGALSHPFLKLALKRRP